jgi:23S rRNA-/tRNA-specific pseudouridylate synthase
MSLIVYQRISAVNRLDRLTSGLMIIPLVVERARQLTSEFMAGTVRKVYVARCQGRFPA